MLCNDIVLQELTYDIDQFLESDSDEENGDKQNKKEKQNEAKHKKGEEEKKE